MNASSRRKFLRHATRAAGASVAFGAFPPAIRRALAIPAHSASGTIQDVQHVVLLMLENRSFDSYFGTMPGVRGYGDRFTIPLPNGLGVFQQTDANGARVLPYHLDETRGNAQRVTGTPHTWVDTQNAWDGGRMNQWPRYKTTRAMGYYERAEVPFHRALAEAFTICDGYHAAMHAGTIPNRLFFFTGTNGPTGAGVAVVNNAFNSPNMGPATQGWTWTTYAERLQTAGVSWKVYQNMPDNYGCNEMMSFRQFRAANEKAPAERRVSSQVSVVSPAHDAAIDDPGNPLFKGIANTMPDGGLLGAFKQDCLAGTLPQVSWLIAPAAYSEHPGPSSPVQGGWYMQEVLDALTANPDVWAKTVLLINYDENDGFFDHVPSPSAPSLNPDGSMAGATTLAEADVAFERYHHAHPPGTTKQPPQDGRVYGPGLRVPMLVISPWSRGGWVASQEFDHTSVLRFLEVRFGVREPNISPYRRAALGDLTSAFNFASPNDEALPALAGRRRKADADALRARQEMLAQIPLPRPQTLPTQPRGTRNSRALPYVLHTHARADLGAGVLGLRFTNDGRVGAVFHVYDKHHLDRLPRRYLVEPGKSLEGLWAVQADDAGKYDLWVLGANGYHRAFRGDLAEAGQADAPSTGARASASTAAGPGNDAALPEIQVDYAPAERAIRLALRNDGATACTFTVIPAAYRRDGPWRVTVPPASTRQLRWSVADSGNWYDFEVTVSGHPSWYRRYAGRMETGAHGISDPAVGA